MAARASRAARGDRGVGQVIEKLKASVERGDYYEAHQMYRTVYFRYMGQEKYGDALQLLLSGATLLLRAGQVASGGDLALLLVEVYVQTHTAVNEESLGRIKQIFPLFPPEDHLRARFIKKCLEWSRVEGDNTRGDPNLHHLFGMAYYKEHRYTEAQRHLLYGTDLSARALADMLVQWSLDSAANPPRLDLLLARPVLQLLCLGDLKHANIVYERFIAKHPSVGSFPFSATTPLLNYLHFLLPTCQRDAAPLFRALKEQFAAAISQDQLVAQCVDKVGEVLFGLPSPRAAFGGLLGNLMQSLFSGMPDEDE
eukprot:comp20541_c0_seq1/m.26341 comp20541_c0_seq1/g.26341  ORF comp20541_c0_seq1/g.26341 comp20541_c0_seq1/m.26341 type:complete len:311 (-) comp20541_c0_seq1:186-1118(-)